MYLSSLILLPTLLYLSSGARPSKSGPSDLDRVYTSISSLSEDIRTEQQSHESNFQIQLLQCQSEIKYREKELSDAEYAFSRAVVEHDMCQQEYQYTSSKYSHHQQFEDFITSNLGKTLGIRGLLQSYSDKKLQAYDQLLSTASQVTSQKSVPELVQVSTAALKNEEFEVATQLVDASEWTGEKLVRAIEGIQVSVQAARNERVSIVSSSQIHIQNIVEAMGKIKKGYADTYMRLQEYLGTMEECMQKQENLKFIASDMELRSKNLLRDIGTLCRGWADQFKELTQNRNKELELLASLNLIVAKRFI